VIRPSLWLATYRSGWVQNWSTPNCKGMQTNLSEKN
jgi:hypothetical protein